MKNLADIKRRMTIGTKLVMERNDWTLFNKPNPLLGIPRKIAQVRDKEVKFESHAAGSDGSWLTFPRASAVLVTGDDTFAIMLQPDDNRSKLMTYRFVGE